MHIDQLRINNLRVFAQAVFQPSPGLNLVTGNNGSGKTSLLEAIYILGRGRSFRHRESAPFIRKDCKVCRVVADIELETLGHSRLGIERTSSTMRVRQDNKDLHKRSDLFRAMPLHLITPRSHEIIERGPELRRKFIDHAMFHVEHGYHSQLFEYYRSLKQRNAALRQGNARLAHSFDDSLSRLGQAVSDARVDYTKRLWEYIRRVLVKMDVGFDIHLDYLPGWKPNTTFECALKEQISRDINRGYTTSGPHRGDIEMLVEGVPAAKSLSRGQQKLLVYALKLSQCRVAVDLGVESPLLLIDDLAAELDPVNLSKLMGQLGPLGIQVIITSVTSSGFAEFGDLEVFHVEHGAVNRVNS